MAENTFLRTLVNQLKDEDTSIVADELGSAEFSACIDTGCLGLNALCSGSLSGGIPDNKFIALAGESATGKSFLCLGIVKSFLDKYTDGVVVIYDTESTIRSKMLSVRGIDPSRVMLVELATIQQFRTHCVNLLEIYKAQEKKPPMMMVLDSLGMLSTEKETGDIVKGDDKRDMTRAGLARGAFRVIRLKAAKLHVPMLITNHTYASMSQYGEKEIMSGGGGLKYAADIILTLKKSKDIVDKKAVGVFIKVTTFKSRISKENQSIILKLNYNTGLDRHFGLVELAEKYGVITKDGKKFVINGQKYWGGEIDDRPELIFDNPTNMAMLEAAVIKEFCYGQDEKLERVDPETGEILPVT